MSVIYCILVLFVAFSELPKSFPRRTEGKGEKTLMICNESELLLIICVNCMSKSCEDEGETTILSQQIAYINSTFVSVNVFIRSRVLRTTNKSET